jgi:hypothetical protein
MSRDIARPLDIATSLHQDVEQMRTTVTLDTDIYEIAAQMAQSSGLRLGQVLSQLARAGLTTTPSAHNRGPAFPTFHVPPGTPPISSRQVELLSDEES